VSDTTSGGYRPGLDGLRALAVAAVVLFHLDRLPGGNLGVDSFFVVSGWLITWRLLNEADQSGTIAIGSFWNARLRRLLPASLTVLAVVAVVWPLLEIDVPSLRRDLLWAGGWASNWGTTTSGGDYWARFGEPSPVTHFWSLAIEEQFYFVWPLVLLVAVKCSREGPIIPAMPTDRAARDDR
jgi:peptidoglycan/LPS O-acetylase OafA/YrhL